MLDQQRGELAASTPTGDTPNTPFSPKETGADRGSATRDQATPCVNNLRSRARALESRIEQLEEAAKKEGRRDWYLMLMGVLFTWTLEGLVPPEGLQVALRLAGQGIGHLSGGGVPQLPMA